MYGLYRTRHPAPAPGTAGMKQMKKDMGGAALVLALAHVAMAAGLRARLLVMVPAVENSIAGNAYRPLDVLRTRAGISVEVGLGLGLGLPACALRLFACLLGQCARVCTLLCGRVCVCASSACLCCVHQHVRMHVHARGAGGGAHGGVGRGRGDDGNAWVGHAAPASTASGGCPACSCSLLMQGCYFTTTTTTTSAPLPCAPPNPTSHAWQRNLRTTERQHGRGGTPHLVRCHVSWEQAGGWQPCPSVGAGPGVERGTHRCTLTHTRATPVSPIPQVHHRGPPATPTHCLTT